jgi:hypothetical protein
MRWIVFAVSAIVLLGVLVTIVGAFLPRGHVASRTARYRQPADVVYRVISDFRSAPAWRPDLKKVEILPPRDGKTVFREHGKNGAMVFVVEEMTPPNRLVNRIVDQSAFGGTWTFLIAPEPSGCRLEITERGEVFNPVFRVLSRLFFSQTATMERYLRALGSKFDESVVPEPGDMPSTGSGPT